MTLRSPFNPSFLTPRSPAKFFCYFFLWNKSFLTKESGGRESLFSEPRDNTTFQTTRQHSTIWLTFHLQDDDNCGTKVQRTPSIPLPSPNISNSGNNHQLSAFVFSPGQQNHFFSLSVDTIFISFYIWAATNRLGGGADGRWRRRREKEGCRTQGWSYGHDKNTHQTRLFFFAYRQTDGRTDKPIEQGRQKGATIITGAFFLSTRKIGPSPDRPLSQRSKNSLPSNRVIALESWQQQ